MSYWSIGLYGSGGGGGGGGAVTTVADNSTFDAFNVMQAVSSADSGMTYYTSQGVAVSGAIKASAGNLYAFHGYCTDTTVGRFLHIFDSAAVPANGTVPILCFNFQAANANTSPVNVFLTKEDFGGVPRQFASGISWGVSSSRNTFTTAGTASTVGIEAYYK